jgi:methylenetetrahydrofolate dehydrogenase (NADP+)/methenyltetrahydrofolate cyclohydrolase
VTGDDVGDAADLDDVDAERELRFHRPNATGFALQEPRHATLGGVTAQLIDGAAIAAEIRRQVAGGVARLRERGIVPGLAAILVGDNPASISYVSAKARASDEVGIRARTYHLPAETPQEELLALVDRLNADPEVHTILPQLPLPPHIDERAVLERILPAKDADGLHPWNLGKLLRGDLDGAIPCTPHGVQQLLLRTGNDPGGKHVVVVGRSTLVGRPLAVLLTNKAPGANATVTICHTGTPDLGLHTRQADILVVAAGRPRTITAEMVKPGAVVIDVGTNRVDDPSRKRGWRLVGDVDFEAVREVAGWITPVPGGVGPMTIAMLLVNTLRAAERVAGLPPSSFAPTP